MGASVDHDVCAACWTKMQDRNRAERMTAQNTDLLLRRSLSYVESDQPEQVARKEVRARLLHDLGREIRRKGP